MCWPLMPELTAFICFETECHQIDCLTIVIVTVFSTSSYNKAVSMITFIQCGVIITWYIFSQILTIDTTQLTCRGDKKIPHLSCHCITLNGLKFDMLMYPAHLENWLDFRHHLLIFLILASFWLSETGQVCVFQAFSWGGDGLKFGMLMYSDDH